MLLRSYSENSSKNKGLGQDLGTIKTVQELGTKIKD